MVQYQEKMNQKIRNEYNIKQKQPKVPSEKSRAAAMVYGERMFMSKYKNRPKFMQNLNSTLSPRKEVNVCLT